MHAIFWALKRVGKPEPTIEEAREKVKSVTMALFIDEVARLTGKTRRTIYRWIGEADAIVACLGEGATDDLVGTPIGNDDKFLKKLPELPRHRALDVVRTYRIGAGKAEAERHLKQELLAHRMATMKPKATTLVGSTVSAEGERMRNIVLYGDCLTRLREIPDNHVHCIVTSPPFFRARDFGTSAWFGGDPSCAHDEAIVHAPSGPESDAKYQTARASFEGTAVTTTSCSKCGAWRGELGQEPTIDLYIAHTLVEVFREARRGLRADGVAWVEIGDTYETGTGAPSPDTTSADVGGWKSQQKTGRTRAHVDGVPTKNLLLIPERLSLALQADGWIIRARIIWHKPAAMPDCAKDRPSVDYTHILLLVKSAVYFYDSVAVMERTTGNANPHPSRAGASKVAAAGKGIKWNESLYASIEALVSVRNLRSVWTLPIEPFRGAHSAPFPMGLPMRCIRASTSEHGACSACGAPWRRVVHKAGVGSDIKQVGSPAREVLPPPETIGWEPMCDCGIRDVHPCIVEDPFLGSGTTAAAAKALGRDYIGIEMQEKECRPQIEKRLADAANRKVAEPMAKKAAAAPHSKRRRPGLAKAKERAAARSKSARSRTR
jgi:DNA modification methylase